MQSRCPKCGNTAFELVETPVKNAKYKYYFIQCSSCGCVVGTKEYFNVGALLQKLAEKLNINLFN